MIQAASSRADGEAFLDRLTNFGIEQKAACG
jgi:hypothetical protein